MNGRPPRRPGEEPPRSPASDRLRPGFGGRAQFEPELPASRRSGADPFAESPEGEGEGDDYVPFGGRGWDVALPEGAGEDEDVEGGDSSPRRRRRGAPESPFPRKTLPSLTATARVERDSQGVPHIRAKSERDAYAALGYCMAEDRLWQLDVVRRIAVGRAAEIFGQPYARHDALVRTAGVPRRAAIAAGRLSGVARDVLAAFVGGLNVARTAGRPPEAEALGYEIEPWTVADCLAVELFLAWQATLETWPQKILAARAIATAGLERARWVAPFPLDLDLANEERTSLWRRIDLRVLELVAGVPAGAGPLRGCAFGFPAARTASGGALVAASVELPPTLPSPTYVAHLEAPGLNLVGTAYVGLPIFVAGRNASVAWSAACAAVDDADCVLEELDGIGNFRTEKGWTKLNRRSEVIRVADAGQIRIEVAETRNGPLLSSLAEQLLGPSGERRTPGVALRWGVNSLGSSVAGWLALARSASVKDLAAATRELDRGPLSLDIVAGDAAGAVRAVAAGVLPQREPIARLPVRGWCSEGRWSAVAARSGAAAPAGEVAIATGEPSGDAGARARAPAGWRARRAAEVASSAAALDAEGGAAMLEDRADGLASLLLADLRTAADSTDDAALRSALAAVRFAEWDGRARADSGAAALYYAALLDQLPREIFPAARFGPLADFPRIALRALSGILTAEASPWFPDAAAKARALEVALRSAAARLREALGPDPASWSWRDLAPTALSHPLVGRDAFATITASAWGGGSPFTIAGVLPGSGAPPWAAASAPTARFVADLGTNEALVVIATGQSGRSDSPHLRDQIEMFREGRAMRLSLGSHTTAETLELVAG